MKWNGMPGAAIQNKKKRQNWPWGSKVNIFNYRYSWQKYSLKFLLRSDDPTVSYKLKSIFPDKICDIRTHGKSVLYCF